MQAKREELNVSKSSPLYPTVRTSTRRAGTSQKDQQQKLFRRRQNPVPRFGRKCIFMDVDGMRLSPTSYIP
jgi:hypothetical protein